MVFIKKIYKQLMKLFKIILPLSRKVNKDGTRIKYYFMGIQIFYVRDLEIAKEYHFLFRWLKKIEKSTTSQKSLISITNHRPTKIIFDLNCGGGTKIYFFTVQKQLSSDYNVFRIQFFSKINEYRVTLYTQDEQFFLWVSSFKKLKSIIAQINFNEVIVNHLIEYPHIQKHLDYIVSLKNKNRKISARIHDFYSICPFYNLMDGDCFCGGPTPAKCPLCFVRHDEKLLPAYVSKKTDILAWQKMWESFYQQIDEVIFFSNNSLRIFQMVYPSFKNQKVVPHEVLALRKVKISPHKGINIAVLGDILNVPKGQKIIQKLEKLLDHSIRLMVIGRFDAQTDQTIVTGPYERENLPDLMEKHQIDIVFIPSVCPETFSYTTAEAIMMGLPVACFNIGAPVERVSKYKKGLIISKIDAQVAVDEMVQYVNKERE